MMTDRNFNRWRPHPWHGLEVGPQPPSIVNAFIEITPFDFVKYEVDKVTGYMLVDRPQRTSSLPPTLYGFIPRTYCGKNVALLSNYTDQADGDPLDVCVVSERPITRSEVILTARVVGGIHMIDGGEADDKIIAVLENDNFWGGVNDVSELPSRLIERLEHYFATYKLLPGEERKSQISLEGVYDHHDAQRVVESAMQDYKDTFQ
jgi:inorganic pyrophosphatase